MLFDKFTIESSPVVSDISISVMLFMLLALAVFIFGGLDGKKKIKSIHKYYLCLCGSFAVWLIAIIAMRFTSIKEMGLLQFWDACTYVGVAGCPVFMLFIALSFANGFKEIPKKFYFLLIIPIITLIMVFSNNLHGLMYAKFDVIKENIEFGPYIYISGVLTYLFAISSVACLLVSFIKNKEITHRRQAVLLTLGIIFPSAVSALVTFGPFPLGITVTPMSFFVPMICNYIAIYKFHLFDIVPVATSYVLDCIPDGYLVLNENHLIVDCNKTFNNEIGSLFNLSLNTRIEDYSENEDPAKKNLIYSILSAIESSSETRNTITYEQPFTVFDSEGESKRLYYVVDVSPIFNNDLVSGFALIFKNVTDLRNSLETVQESKLRLMEQERLAMLGQTVGGLAHNLKTPIMGIAGCTSAIESLVQEIQDSIGDPDVTEDDYREINGEIFGWIAKIRDSCSYMSDIITAIKGQATTASANDVRTFSIDEVIKRSKILMKHELLKNNVELIENSEYDVTQSLSGDINSIIQVLNNLITNAIDAMKATEIKKITLGVNQGNGVIKFSVQDSGPGVPESVKERLFKEMITTKGTKGTGLGLYISSTLIRGKFGGEMWVDNAPEGGAIFGFSIPVGSQSAIKPEEEA